MRFITATSVKNEGPYILEWVAHCSCIGFDTLIVFSNDNTDGSDELLQALSDLNIIVWKPQEILEGEAPQAKAFAWLTEYLCQFQAHASTYLMWIDVDEFLLLHRHDSVLDLVADYDYPDGLFINWKHFSNSGLSSYANSLTIERFLQSSYASHFNKQGKTLYRADGSLYRILRIIFLYRKIYLMQEFNMQPLRPSLYTCL